MNRHSPSTDSGGAPRARTVSRRSFLAAAAGLGAVGISGLRSGDAWARQSDPIEAPPILERETWAWDLPPKAEIPSEEVRFLLVHHTVQPANDYGADDVIGILRGIYDFHTSPAKGWPDIAYNFMIDRFGRIFEARSGSLAGAVAGSATGGNQGYSQLCCFLGDHSNEPPTEEAQASMIWLLAWLAGRYTISLDPGATVSFVSRGSNRWEAGATVVTSTIAGHRDMSMTECPGDACYELLDTRFRPAAEAAARAPASSVPTTTTAPATTNAASTNAASTDAPSTNSTPTNTASTNAPSTSSTSTNQSGLGGSEPSVAEPQTSPITTKTLGVVGLGAIAGAASAIAIRQRLRPPARDDQPDQ